MKKEDLDKYLGKRVRIVLISGKVIEGVLGFIPEFSARYLWRSPNYYYINEYSFKAPHVKKFELREVKDDEQKIRYRVYP